jgi:4-amino-4-deoxy-L-arabinose transferase-like glycosyltransferase
MRFWADPPAAVAAAGRVRLMLVLLAYLGLVSFGFGPELTDDHAFRQTQTAITAHFIHGLGDLWRYETPVLGPPWSVPFEFPLYQALAKGLSVVAGLSLETAGRLVGVGAMLLCVWPLTRIAQALGAGQPAWVLAPVFLAPLYVFWSRAFMIETTALLFALIYLDMLLRMLRTGRARRWWLAGLVVSGLLAALVKVTTLLPLMLLAGLAMAWLAWQVVGRRTDAKLLGSLLLAHLLIVVPAWVWLAHADALKAANPVGAFLTSQALTQWNFGTPAQRLDPQVWFQVADHAADMLFPLPEPMRGFKALLVGIWLAVFVFFLRRCDSDRRVQVAAVLALFLAPFLVFTNLHRVHTYYQAANGVFLLLAFGLAAEGALASGGRARRAVPWAFGLSVLALGVASFCDLHVKGTQAGQLREISAQLQAQTSADEVVAITGQDWSPVIPYQAGRRALMIPPFATLDVVRANARELRAAGAKLTALVRCGTGQEDAVRLLLSELGLQPQGPRWVADGCTLTRLAPRHMGTLQSPAKG